MSNDRRILPSPGVSVLCLTVAMWLAGLAACRPSRSPDLDLAHITLLPTVPEPPTPVPYLFGLILGGSSNDNGWNQAHYLAGTFVEAKVADTKMLYIENAAATAEQAARQLAAQGARLIIFSSREMGNAALAFARDNPHLYIIIIGGDQAWPEGKHYAGLPNVSNISGRMEYGKMISGCAAALSTQNGRLGYLASQPDEEGRRLAASAYLGARYCWQTYRGREAREIQFQITWTDGANPLQAATAFYADGNDVIISDLLSQEVALAAQTFADAGMQVRFIPYVSITTCEQKPATCLGVPYFNWGPAYVTAIRSALGGTWQPVFRWNGPDWADINESETSAVGFIKGGALLPQESETLDRFVEELAFGLPLWSGPLNLQDGTPYLLPGQPATEAQIWYLPQILEGMQD